MNELGLSRPDSKSLINTALNEITDALNRGEVVKVSFDAGHGEPKTRPRKDGVMTPHFARVALGVAAFSLVLAVADSSSAQEWKDIARGQSLIVFHGEGFGFSYAATQRRVNFRTLEGTLTVQHTVDNQVWRGRGAGAQIILQYNDTPRASGFDRQSETLQELLENIPFIGESGAGFSGVSRGGSNLTDFEHVTFTAQSADCVGFRGYAKHTVVTYYQYLLFGFACTTDGAPAADLRALFAAIGISGEAKAVRPRTN